jgi:hypothetical protein
MYSFNINQSLQPINNSMTAIKHKTHPGFLSVMYHVFVGSVLQFAYKLVKSLCVLVAKTIYNCAVFVWYLAKQVVILPLTGGKFIGNLLFKKLKINSIMADLMQTLAIWTGLKILSCLKLVLRFLYNTGWLIIHQFALTSLKNIRVLEQKPIVSIGWELYGELFPRHKLDYWMGDSHITVEIRSWSYNQKYNRLRYIETGTKKTTHVCSPHGIPYMVSRVHWWEPSVQASITPYTPLHSVSKQD